MHYGQSSFFGFSLSILKSYRLTRQIWGTCISFELLPMIIKFVLWFWFQTLLQMKKLFWLLYLFQNRNYFLIKQSRNTIKSQIYFATQIAALNIFINRSVHQNQTKYA